MAWTKVGNLTPPTSTVTPVEPYVRPTDWLPLPAVNVGEQKVVGLYAVFPYDGPNSVALSCAGNYTVDWGDGTAPENVATGVQVNHIYTYASLSAGTGTTRGYRQAIATITPQSGQTLTVVNLGLKHPQQTSYSPSTGWLDVCMAGASVTTLVLGMDTSQSAAFSAGFLEQFEYKGPSAITNISYLFMNCYNLRSIKGAQFTATATTATGLITGCTSLKVLADLNLSKLTTAASLFANNKSLQRVTGINASTASSAASMFNTCDALVEVTDVNVAAATTVSQMFSSCDALRTVTTINAPNATNFGTMFGYCTNLTAVSGLTVTSGTVFDSMFSNCVSLRTAPSFNTSLGTTFSGMFGSCSSLQQVPVYNTAKGANFTNMFNLCNSLTELPAWNMAAATNTTGFVSNCPSLSSVGVTGLKVTCNFSGCRLSSAALDALYTQLGTAGATITVTGNYGTTGDNPSIATAKGWTVTGS